MLGTMLAHRYSVNIPSFAGRWRATWEVKETYPGLHWARRSLRCSETVVLKPGYTLASARVPLKFSSQPSLHSLNLNPWGREAGIF